MEMEKVTNSDIGGGGSKIWIFAVTIVLNGPLLNQLANSLLMH